MRVRKRRKTVNKDNLTAALKIFFLMFMTVNSLSAQTTDASPTPTPVSPEEARLDEEIRLLKKEKERVALLKEIRDAQTPSGVTPLEGKATGVKDIFMEVEMQSYKAVSRVTDKIACDIKTKIPSASNIILYRPEDYNQWRNYKLMHPVLDQQLVDLQTRYDTYLNNPATAQPALIPGLGGIADVTAALKAFVGLVSFLRTDIEFEARAVTIDEMALRSGMLKSIRAIYPATDAKTCKNVTAATSPALFDPSVFSPTISESGNFESATLEKIKNLYLSKARAEEAVRLFDVLMVEIESVKKAETEAKNTLAGLKVIIATNPTLIAQLDAQIKQTKDPERKKELIAARDKAFKDLEKAKENKPTAEADLQDLTARKKALEAQVTDVLKLKIAGLRQANADFNQFLTNFTKLDPTTGSSPLAQYIKAENLDGILARDETYWLQIKPVKAGGNNRVRKNLVRFIIGPDISHSGGFIAQFMLGNKKGEVILSNTEGNYLKYTKADKIQQ
jgi:hypothetical protein